MDRTTPPLTVLLAVALMSMAALAYEILLMRLLSIVQWHHFAYVIISLALLGYGASGSVLSLMGQRARTHYPVLLIVSCLGFAITAAGGFLLAQKVSFNPLELLWDPNQWLRLAAVYTLLLWPFLFAASVVCLTLARFDRKIGLIYGCDLIGAAVGALGVIGLLEYFFPLTVLGFLAALGCIAAACVWFGLALKPIGFVPLLLLMAGGLFFAMAGGSFELHLSPYKPLSQALSASGARVVGERSGPLGLLTVVENQKIPLRHAPGLSLGSHARLPPQLAVFTDGDGMSAITRFDGELKPLAFLDRMPSALPYQLLHHPKVLVLGAGGGMDVLQALYHRADSIDAVELDPNMITVVNEDFGDFSGHLFANSRVEIHVAEARGYVASNRKRYDLIQMGLLDAFNTAASGLHALNETYLYTVEGIRTYLSRLTPGGLLAITRWIRIPPREELKLFAACIKAMESMGIKNPRSHLIWVRSWNTITLLVKARPFTPNEIGSVRQFIRTRGFDPAYYPGISPGEANRRHRLPQPYYYQAAVAILNADRGFTSSYKFDITPATDDRPYFFHSFKWSSLDELWSLRIHGGIALIDSTYLLLVGTLVQLVILSALLIILPLIPKAVHLQSLPRGRVLGYFFAIGIGFIFVEIALIQKFILYLSYPLYAIAVVLTGMLLWAGVGSGSVELLRNHFPALTIWWAVAAILCLVVADVTILPWLIDTTAAISAGLKIVLSLMLLAPLAFCMGLPFPLGMSQGVVSNTKEEAQASWISWAWAVNGCASVTGAVLASLLAIHLGLTFVLGMGLAAYLLAGLLLSRTEHWQ